MYRTKEYYKNLIKEKKDFKIITLNFIEAFVSGGLLCLIGNLVYMLLLNYFDTSNARLLVSMIVILSTGLLTALGIYDKIGQIAKCGLAIPISGFANACISSALEYKKEGITLGIASNCLKLAGAVIVLGSVSAFFIALARYIVWLII